MRSLFTTVAAFAGLPLAFSQGYVNSYTATATASVAAAKATAKTLSPTSHVKGKAFDRMVVIWLENTDATAAFADPNLQKFQKQGITLTNYFGVTHPSEPNYISSVGGDYFGMDNDAFWQVPANVSTLVDLLEEKGISWGEYEEDLPYSGFEGSQWLNPQGRQDYVRKHNPLVIYNSVAQSQDRLAVIKNFTQFNADLAANKLPQWMFITPNMTDDGHDTSVTVAGAWANRFLTPLLTNKNFMNNTLVLLTFDEDETYSQQNKVYAVLFGDAVPTALQGTTDTSFYTHYSDLSTVEANWGLHTLGRWDVGANVFQFVANKTGDTIRAASNPALAQTYLNASYPGMFNSRTKAPLPVPNMSLVVNGRSVLPAIASVWGSQQCHTFYDGRVNPPSAAYPPQYPNAGTTCPAAVGVRNTGNGGKNMYE